MMSSEVVIGSFLYWNAHNPSELSETASGLPAKSPRSCSGNLQRGSIANDRPNRLLQYGMMTAKS